MTPRTVTLPPVDPKMWRRLAARAHPDAGGDHELFVRVTTVKEAVCRGIEAPRVERDRRDPDPRVLSRRRDRGVLEPAPAGAAQGD